MTTPTDTLTDATSVGTSNVNGSSSGKSKSPYIDQIDVSIDNVLKKHGNANIKDLDPADRDALNVARCLRVRLDDARARNICPNCWLHQPHCFCMHCPPVTLDSSKIRRIFLVLHHREVFMGVDTAKLILKAFPESTRLVVAGIPAEYQASMAELEEAVAQHRSNSDSSNRHLLVLFPDESAKTWPDILSQSSQPTDTNPSSITLDLIVIDGTWQQARRIKNRYFQSFPPTTKLGPAAVKALSEGDLGQGHQLRAHPVTWKKIATFEAVRLFLADVWTSDKDNSAGSNNTGNSNITEQEPWEKVKDYVKIANETTIQLGAHHKLR